MDRRTFVLALLLVGCSAQEGANTAVSLRPQALAAASPPSWVVPSLVVQAGGSTDLAATLPAEVPRGGVFYVASGTPLPAGVTLSPSGVLSATNNATPTSVSGVVFGYDY